MDEENYGVIVSMEAIPASKLLDLRKGSVLMQGETRQSVGRQG